jgi:hypothetical protein
MAIGRVGFTDLRPQAGLNTTASRQAIRKTRAMEVFMGVPAA